MRLMFRFWRLVVATLWLGAVAILTLRGARVEAEWLAELPRLCAICGSRGTADAILNVVLFLPLGFALGGRRAAWAVALAAGLGISAGIELLQTMLPGRHPSPADVILNAGGAVLGTVLYAAVRARLGVGPASRSFGIGAEPAGGQHLRPPALLSAWSWGAAVGACLMVAGFLLVPAATDQDYWGQWMPDLGSMPQYDGVVRSAELNGLPMPSRRLDHPRPHRSQLENDWQVRGSIVIGSEPRAVSPILSIYDGHQQEVLLLGAHQDALVFRQRMLANHLRLDAPDIRIPGAFRGMAVGDTTTIGARHEDGVTCLWVGVVEECGVGVTAGRTWGLLLYVEGSAEPFRHLVDLIWLAGLFLPIGFFASDRRELLGGTGVAVAALLVSTAFTPMILGPWLEVAACLVGALLGRLSLYGLQVVGARGQADPGEIIDSRV